MTSVTASWQDPTLYTNVSAALNDSVAGGGTGMAAAAVIGAEKADPEVTANVTVAMAAMDAAMATSGGGDRHALLYIVVVLAFYAIGIIAALTMYLRQERADIDEEKVYDDYAAIHRDPWKWARYYRMQQVMTRLHSLKMENEQRHTREDGHGGDGQHTEEGHQLNNDELDELTIDIPRLLGEGGATKRMALPDGETVVVTFRMPNADSGFRLSRPSSLIRKRYETIDEERESVTDSDKSSHLGENGTTADNELSDDSIKERQRLRVGTGRSSKRKRSFEQPLLKSRYDRVEKNEFNILDDEKDLDDASSETGFEPSDNGAILRTWGIKPRISRWSDCMDLSEMTSSPTDDHSSGNLLSSIGSPCRDDPVDIDLEKANVSTITIPNVTSVKPKNPPVTIQYVIDENSDINQNRSKSRTGELYNIPPVPTVDADFDSDPTSLESTHKRQNFGACDLRWKAENKKFLKLPTSSSATFKSSKPTDIDAAYKEMSKPFSHSRMIYDLLEANYSRSLPFLSAKGKPTDLDSVSQLLTVNTEEIEGGMMHGIRCSSSPSIPNCKASDIFQFARPDSTESHFYDQEVSSPLLAVPGGAPRFRHEGVASSTDGSITSIENMLDDITVTLPEPNRIHSAPTGLILQPNEYIIKNTYMNSVPPRIPTSPALKATTPPEAKPIESSNITKGPSLSSSFSKSGSFHSSCEDTPTVNISDDSKADMKSLTSLHSLTRENSLELPKSPNIGQYEVKDRASTHKEKAMGIAQISSMESLSDGSLGLSDIENPSNNPPIEINTDGAAEEVGKVKPEPTMGDTDLKGLSKPSEPTTILPAAAVNTNRQVSGINAQQRDATAQQPVSEGKAGSLGGSHSGIDTSLTPNTSGADSANRTALARDKAADCRPGAEPVWTYPKISEKSESSLLEDGEGTSGEYTSCDEISLLADDYVYASNERVNTDFEDEDDDEEAGDISDEFASETFTELEKLADEGSIDNLVDDQCCTPDGSDLPLDMPADDNSGPYSDFKLRYGIRPRPEGESQSTFTDAKMSSAEEIIKKWIADNLKAGEMKSAKPLSVRSSIPKLTTSSSGSYVQSSKRETTFLPDSHKCVSESTLGDVISERGAAAKPGPAKPAAAKAGPTKSGAVRGSTAGVAPTPRGPSAPLHRKIPPAPARGGNFANSGASSLAVTRSLMARPTTAPLSRLRTPGVRGRAASSSSAYTKGSYQSPSTTTASSSASDGKNSAAGTTPKQTFPKQELNSAKYRPATTGAAAAAANGSLANRRRPNTAMDRSSTVGASTPVGTRPKQQQGPGGKFTTSKIQQPTALSKTQSRPRTQIGKADTKATGNIMQLGNKLNKTGTSATNAQATGAKAGGTRAQGGPHNVHGATSGIDMTPRTARRLTSRVTTI